MTGTFKTKPADARVLCPPWPAHHVGDTTLALFPHHTSEGLHAARAAPRV